MALRCFNCGSADPGEKWWGKRIYPWYWFCTGCSFTEIPGGRRLSKVDLNLEHYTGFKRWIRGAAPASIPLLCGHGRSSDAAASCSDCARIFRAVEVFDVETGTAFVPRTLPHCRHCETLEALETACPTCSSTLCRFCVTYDGACPKCTVFAPKQICPKCRAFLPMSGNRLRSIEGKLIVRGEVFKNDPPEVTCDRCGHKRGWISTPTKDGLPSIKILDGGGE